MSKVTIQFEGGPGVEFESEVLCGPWVDMWHKWLQGGDPPCPASFENSMGMNEERDRLRLYVNGELTKKHLDKLLSALLAARILMEGK